MRWHYRHCRHSVNIHCWMFRQPFEITKRPFVVVRGKSYAASAGHRFPASMFNANQAHHAGILHCGSIISVDFLNLILVPSIQMRTPTAFTGKVMAIISSLTICAQPLGQMLYGWLHAHCTVWLILLISALASLPLAWLAHPLFTHLDDTISK